MGNLMASKMSDEPIKTEEVLNVPCAKDINILLVGETGVGKSTWINAMATYLQHDSFDKALEAPLINLISTDFIYKSESKESDDEDDAEIVYETIKIGTDENETTDAGQSRTIKPKVHILKFNGAIIRIIDTPGVNDTHGIIKDKENVQAIVDYISDLAHLNLIIFLLEPNKSRLTAHFEFCFNELVMQFHKSAAQNIVFAFPKSGECGFKVGETFTQLQILLKNIKDQQGIDLPLKNKNVYAFDNIAYRTLCIKEAMLLEIAGQVTPHLPQATAILNYTRTIILRLVGPMTMISTSVQQTLSKIEERQALFKKFRGRESELEKILIKPITIVRYRMEKTDKVFCRTCSKEQYYWDDDRIPYIEADPDVADQNPFIIWEACDMIQKNGEWCCPQCGSDFLKGKCSKIYFSFLEIELKKDVTIASEIESVKKSQKSVNEQIAEELKLRDEIIQEKDEIIRACAKFAAYLKASSILPYNDVTSRYLDVLIEVEENKKEYLEEKAILTARLNSTETHGEVTQEDLSKLIRELIGLKHYGKDIREALDFVKQNEVGSNAHNPQPQTKMWSRKLFENVGDFFSF